MQALAPLHGATQVELAQDVLGAAETPAALLLDPTEQQASPHARGGCMRLCPRSSSEAAQLQASLGGQSHAAGQAASEPA